MDIKQGKIITQMEHSKKMVAQNQKKTSSE